MFYSSRGGAMSKSMYTSCQCVFLHLFSFFTPRICSQRSRHRCAATWPASSPVFHLCVTAINHSQSLLFGECCLSQNGATPLIPSLLCQEWCEGPGGGRREEIAMSGRVPAEEAFYGHCKQRAGHTAPMQLFAEEQARKCVVYETIRPVTGTVRAR